MTKFTLDGDKRFTENSAAFLENIKEIDSELAEILETNWDKLLVVVRAGERDTKSRTTFNEEIASALDDLLAQEAETEIE